MELCPTEEHDWIPGEWEWSTWGKQRCEKCSKCGNEAVLFDEDAMYEEDTDATSTD